MKTGDCIFHQTNPLSSPCLLLLPSFASEMSISGLLSGRISFNCPIQASQKLLKCDDDNLKTIYSETSLIAHYQHRKKTTAECL